MDYNSRLTTEEALLAGDYRFYSVREIREWRRLSSDDERWACLVFARQRHARERRRVADNSFKRNKYKKKSYLIMREWLRLPESTRDDRIAAARTDDQRPDVWEHNEQPFTDPRHGSPGSINELEDLPGPDASEDAHGDDDDYNSKWSHGLRYIFLRPLFRRNFRETEIDKDTRIWTAVNLYAGVDDENRLRDVGIPASPDKRKG